MSDLREQALDRPSFGKEVRMGAMVAPDRVLRSQRRADAYRDRFLSDRQVTRAYRLAALHHARNGFLCITDPLHGVLEICIHKSASVERLDPIAYAVNGVFG